jgi:hypothetical protein
MSCLILTSLYSHNSTEDGLYVRKPASFPANRSPKNAGTKLFMFGGRFGGSLKGSKNGLRGPLAKFFIN